MYHKNSPFKTGSKLFKKIGDNQDFSGGAKGDEGLKVTINKPQLSSVNDEGVPTCFQCGNSFPSMKSLFAHMRCHPNHFGRGIIPPPNAVLAQGNPQVVGSQRSLKIDDSDEDDEDLLESAKDLMSFANGHRSSVIKESNSNANSPPSIDKREGSYVVAAVGQTLHLLLLRK
nr:zinc finger protein ZAT3-like [Tanacetum cinerariifolium]